MPEVVPGSPHRVLPQDAEAAAALRTRTLTNLHNTHGKPEGAWLKGLHAALDAAGRLRPAPRVAEHKAFAALLALNRERASEQA